MASFPSSQQIKAFALQLGFDLVGIAPVQPLPHEAFFRQWLRQGYAGQMDYLARNADKRGDLEKVLPNAKSVICLALNYNSAEFSPVDSSHVRLGGVIAKYARGKDYHRVMGKKLKNLLAFIQRNSCQQVQGRYYVDTGPVLEREIAVRGGLGWFGKNTNLINKRTGSWLFLAEIILDLALEYDAPVTDHCGTCTRCLEACPTAAIVAPYVLDARLCISYLNIEKKGAIPRSLRPYLGNRIYGCDDCQTVCPWNNKAPYSREPAFQPDLKDPAADLPALLALSEEQFRAVFKGSPIKRVKRRGLLRNVAVALGNLGDRRAIPALSYALRDREMVVRQHAAWALGELGGDEACRTLQRAWESEQDEKVKDELKVALKKLSKPPSGSGQ